MGYMKQEVVYVLYWIPNLFRYENYWKTSRKAEGLQPSPPLRNFMLLLRDAPKGESKLVHIFFWATAPVQQIENLASSTTIMQLNSMYGTLPESGFAFFPHCNSGQTETTINNESEPRKLRTASAGTLYISITDNQWLCRSKIPSNSLFGESLEEVGIWIAGISARIIFIWLSNTTHWDPRTT